MNLNISEVFQRFPLFEVVNLKAKKLSIHIKETLNAGSFAALLNLLQLDENAEQWIFSLGFANAQFSPEQVTQLCKVIEYNSTLERLYIYDNTFLTLEDSKKVQYAVERAKEYRKLNKSSPTRLDYFPCSS